MEQETPDEFVLNGFDCIVDGLQHGFDISHAARKQISAFEFLRLGKPYPQHSSLRLILEDLNLTLNFNHGRFPKKSFDLLRVFPDASLDASGPIHQTHAQVLSSAWIPKGPQSSVPGKVETCEMVIGLQVGNPRPLLRMGRFVHSIAPVDTRPAKNSEQL
jgi:hypothetical protein